MGQSPPPDNDQRAILADRIFDGKRWYTGATVLIQGERVRGVASWGEIPANFRQQRLPHGVFVSPGFIDLQVNGGGGLLLNDDPTVETMRAIARAHRHYGTTACLPTLITDTREKTQAAIAAAKAIAPRSSDEADEEARKSSASARVAWA